MKGSSFFVFAAVGISLYLIFYSVDKANSQTVSN